MTSPLPPEIILPTGRPAFQLRSVSSNIYAEHPAWSRLSLAARRELYRFGSAQGLSRAQTRRAYASGESIGGTGYQQRRARGIASGRIRAGRSYQDYSPQYRARIDSLIAQRKFTTGITRQQALQELRDGTWRPFARDPVDRVPPRHVPYPGPGGGGVTSTGVPYSFDDFGRVSIHPDTLSGFSIADLRQMSDSKAALFEGYLFMMAPTSSEYTKAASDFNAFNFQGNRDVWGTDMHVLFLTYTYEQWRAYTQTRALEWAKLSEAEKNRNARPEWGYH